jgi:hypothetical protein
MLKFAQQLNEVFSLYVKLFIHFQFNLLNPEQTAST